MRRKEGGYYAEAAGMGIFAEGDTINELKESIKSGIEWYWLRTVQKTAILFAHLHFIKNEIMVLCQTPRSVSKAKTASSKRLKFMVTTQRTQKGSHIKITTQLKGEHHLAIPNHDPIKTGTFKCNIKDRSPNTIGKVHGAQM